ncbi:MAG: carboxypeptidase regulatory-like domain-containing protein [Ekhidna sp.]|nr:carboxypeptidase regulatory-like domain-containing protein [Ekhidna sp.]
MILSQRPDPNIHAWELESALNVIKRNVCASASWQFREEYIDQGVFDPYRIIKIRKPEDDKGDDVYKQRLLKGTKDGFSFVHRTTQCTKNYWCDIGRRDLIERLDLFKEHYDLNKLQPPGLRGDLFDPKEHHQIFEKRRYIYEILTPFKSITGIGPGMYALGPGAVCGTMIGMDGKPLDGVEIQLQSEHEALTRKTKDGGLFWFSSVPTGKWKVIVKDHSCTLQVIRRDEFGNIKGWLTNQDGYPVEYADLKFRAPDGKVFKAASDESGKFSTGPLPAYPAPDTPLSNYPYLMDVPDFLFTISKSVFVKDAIISGILKTKEGQVLTGKTVILKRKGNELTRTTTDTYGNFRFFELEGGTYDLEVPDEKIYLSQLASGKVKGKEFKGIVNKTRIELVAKGTVVATERLTNDKDFRFDRVAPGKYEVKTKLSE